VINDDMSRVIEDELWADIIIWSFPLYYFNVPGPLKNLIDRQLPMNLPFMTEREDGMGSGSHPSRYDMSGRRKKNYETIFCGQGELFRAPELKKRTDEYLDIVRKAGREYISTGISNETRSKLNETNG